jgi:hypothetical protein
MSAVPEIEKPKMKPPVMTPEQIKSKYENIELNFGKHNGKSLKYIAQEDPTYLNCIKEWWGKKKDLSPTQLGILKYIKTLA